MEASISSIEKKKRKRTAPESLRILEEEYKKCDKPDKSRRAELSSTLNMPEKAIYNWFQNKRHTMKKNINALSTISTSQTNRQPLRRTSSKLMLGTSHGKARVVAVDEIINSPNKENMPPMNDEVNDCAKSLLALYQSRYD